jgi:6-pyruvoyl tetrahydropterin synthase-like protein
MFEVTVEAGFSSGHYLRNYHGKCENPHGHNYKVKVTLVGEQLDETEIKDNVARSLEIENCVAEILSTGPFPVQDQSELCINVIDFGRRDYTLFGAEIRVS